MPLTELEPVQSWRVTAPKGRGIYDEGQPPEAFYRVESGCVRLQVIGADGRRQILAFFLLGDVFGLDCGDCRQAAAEATVKTDLTRYPIAAVERLLGSNPAAATRLMTAACDMVHALSAHLVGMGHASAEERAMWFFEWLSGRQGAARGAPLDLPMNRRDVADFLGLAQETLSRTLTRLEERNLIGVLGPRRIVLRPPARIAA